jgi:hypothetical protein
MPKSVLRVVDICPCVDRQTSKQFTRKSTKSGMKGEILLKCVHIKKKKL